MNWDDVRLFLAVARSGQFLAAARRLGVNHATLARRVTALEAALGTQLFVRRPQGCEMTEEGERFLAAADATDHAVLARSRGPVLDLGCGPGRMVRAALLAGRPALGVDVSPAAVRRVGGCPLG